MNHGKEPSPMPDRFDIPAAAGGRCILGEKDTFSFGCHPKVSCFTRCCRNADMYLYPYDILRLKKRLNMASEAFLAAHTVTAFRENPYFPNVMLKMSDQPDKACSFLTDDGCQVYEDRPYSCRAYPLEPAMYGDGQGGVDFRFYLVRHGHCRGYRQQQRWTPGQWMEDQQMEPYHDFNAGWARIDSLLRQNPFGEQGAAHPAAKMVYMAAYNIDTFRRFVFGSSFLDRYVVPEKRLDAVKESDRELLRLGLDWILRLLAGQGPIREKGAPQ
jgi:Fe-S-cluster containining protein